MKNDKRGVTIVDVARIAGFGTATVSRVLNHHPRVSDKTRTKVLKVIARLKFTPNETARLLRVKDRS